jgi:site-specific DNA recombinase
MRAAIYVRVSTDEQGKSGLGLTDQRGKCADYCRLRDYVVDRVVEDAGYSGKDLQRPGMLGLLAAVKAKEVDVVVVAKLDRLTRSTRDLDELLEGFNATGVELASVAEHLDTSTAGGRMVVGMLGVVAKWEREVIVERITSALAVKGKRGERRSRFAPYGYRFEGDKVVPDKDAQAVIRYARTLRTRGKSYTAIAAALNQRGHRTLANRPHSTMSAYRLVNAQRMQPTGG